MQLSVNWNKKKQEKRTEKENNLNITKKANQLRPFSIQVSNAQSAYDQACEKLETVQKETSCLQSHFEKTEKEYQRNCSKYTTGTSPL